MPNLVGIGLSQVPTNSMLGGLAYQDPEHASIKDLDLKNLSQINSEIADTAVDVFIYDTSMDSDGGAWRKRTQHTSWYNETLGTATRGTRREFPAVAVIVATIDDVIIYDGDDPDLPMWMIFESGHSGNAWENYYLGRANDYSGFGPAIRGFAMLNATLVVGKDGSDAGNFTEAYTEIDFLSDDCRHRDSSSANIMNGNIQNRNGTAGGYHNYFEIGSLVDYDLESVVMTVLQNEPIDPVTGLPAPTAIVSTGGGSCVVHPTFVTDFNDSLGSTRPVTGTIVRGNDIVHWNVNNGTLQQFFDALSATSDSTNKVRYNYTGAGGHATSENYSAVLRDSGDGPYKIVARDVGSIVAAAQPGLSIFVDGEERDFSANNNSIQDSMVAYITSTYNSGMMYGDIRGAFMADTVTEKDGVNYALTGEQDGTNRLSSETYSNGATSWQMVDNAGTANGYIVVALKGLTVGQTYKISMTWDNNAALDSGYQHRVAHKNGTADENDTNFTHWNKTNGSSETLTGVFTAQSVNNDDLVIYANAITLNVSNFSVVETDDADGTSLIPNGNFSANTTGAFTTVGGGTAAVTGGLLKLTDTSGSFCYASAPFTTVIGDQYFVTVDIVDNSNTANANYIRCGNSHNGTELHNTNYGTSYGTKTFYFTATATTTYLTLISGNGVGETGHWDNVFVYKLGNDRSLKSKGLRPYGAITKEPVASGAELLSYSGWSSVTGEINYMKQEYNSDLDFGTGDFSFTWWQYVPGDIPENLYIYDRAGNNAARHAVILYTGNGGRVSMYTTTGSSTSEFYLDNINQYKNQWTSYTICRTSDGFFKVYINGRIKYSTGGFTVRNITNTSAELFVGVRHSIQNASNNTVKLALMRFSRSVPTERQVAEAYAMEESLFRENAKATLYGTSSDVKALAYDKKTGLLHAGTSAGRSDFQGLRRINNTTTAVTTAISAHDGFIVEQ